MGSWIGIAATILWCSATLGLGGPDKLHLGTADSLKHRGSTRYGTGGRGNNNLIIGAIFTPYSRELQTAYEFTMYEHNRGESRFKVNSTAGIVMNDDPFNLTREGKPELNVFLGSSRMQISHGTASFVRLKFGNIGERKENARLYKGGKKLRSTLNARSVKKCLFS